MTNSTRPMTLPGSRAVDEVLRIHQSQRSSLSAAGRAPNSASLGARREAPSGRIAERCDHSVTSLRALTHQRSPYKPLTCGFGVGMRGFEPRISGPPDRRPGPSWATSRVVRRRA